MSMLNAVVKVASRCNCRPLWGIVSCLCSRRHHQDVRRLSWRCWCSRERTNVQVGLKTRNAICPGCGCGVANTSGKPEFVTEVIWGFEVTDHDQERRDVIASQPHSTRLLCGGGG